MLFVFTFLAVYAAMHALVFWGIHPLLTGHAALPSLTAVWMGLMSLAPVLVRILDRAGHPPAARALAWVGYCWMGFLFLAFSLFLLVGIWHLAALALARLVPGWPLLTLHRPAGAALVLLAATAAGSYGFYEATDLHLEKVRLPSAKLPPGMESLRIVQVSDLHLGLLHREETLVPIIAAVERLEPDLLVATGDVVDAQIDHLDGLSGPWSRLEPSLGKFAVTGNHEFYAGLDQSLAYLRRSGFTVLRGELAAAGGITVAGVDDPTGGSAANEAALLQGADRERFTLLLKHRPRTSPDVEGLFDLQLSGHAHRGQIFPFNFLTGLYYPMQNGLYQLDGSLLYASRGTGTWGPPMRLFAPPEITLIEIVHQE